jgi:two-component system sensor histidine kinase KdpD
MERRGFLRAVLIMASTAGVAALARGVLHLPDVDDLFFLGAMLCALAAGRTAALLATALGVVFYDLFFLPPEFALGVANVRHLLTFGMMFGVCLVIGSLTLRLREQQQAAVARERRTAALHAFSCELSAALDEAGVVAALERAAAQAAGADAALEAAPTGGTALCIPVHPLADGRALLVVRPREPVPASDELRTLLDAMARQAGVALDRVRLAEDARRAAVRAQTEELRSGLLSSVSHDLRTPLATITGAATALREDPGLEPEIRRELTESIVAEAERLERLVSNLLDMTRLDQGAVVARREWVPADELVGSALTRLESALAGRAIRTALAPDLPLLSVDPVLFEQLLVNLLENAAKHTARGTAIEISARREAASLALEMADRGPGLRVGDEERIFDRFYRGKGARAHGVGLGLSIARAIAVVHGGRLSASNRPGGGAVFRVELPVPAGAPPLDVIPGGRAGAATR